eukprot:1398230-Pyramimonas_sp.AAC.1
MGHPRGGAKETRLTSTSSTTPTNRSSSRSQQLGAPDRSRSAHSFNDRSLQDSRHTFALTSIPGGTVDARSRRARSLSAVGAKRQLATHRALTGTFDVKQQEALSRQVAGELGFSYDHGRFDTSVHPFTGGTHPTDTRITTK